MIIDWKYGSNSYTDTYMGYGFILIDPGAWEGGGGGSGGERATYKSTLAIFISILFGGKKWQ